MQLFASQDLDNSKVVPVCLGQTTIHEDAAWGPGLMAGMLNSFLETTGDATVLEESDDFFHQQCA
jgi:hypothetical protein